MMKAQCSANVCSEALRLMKDALALLDEAAAPNDIGAHLDLAISRLRDHLKLAIAV
jgi:hypothetical protein